MGVRMSIDVVSTSHTSLALHTNSTLCWVGIYERNMTRHGFCMQQLKVCFTVSACCHPSLSIPEGTPKQLQIRHVPVPLTCGVFDGTIVTDPSLLEEELVTTQITVVSTACGKVHYLSFREDPLSHVRNLTCRIGSLTLWCRCTFIMKASPLPLNLSRT